MYPRVLKLVVYVAFQRVNALCFSTKYFCVGGIGKLVEEVCLTLCDVVFKKNGIYGQMN
jgi:hypothetical protein